MFYKGDMIKLDVRKWHLIFPNTALAYFTLTLQKDPFFKHPFLLAYVRIINSLSLNSCSI